MTRRELLQEFGIALAAAEVLSAAPAGPVQTLPKTNPLSWEGDLAERLMDEARVIGYTHMRLDTGPRQLAAQRLYRSLGFKDIAPYYEVPEDMRMFLLFMELAL